MATGTPSLRGSVWHCRSSLRLSTLLLACICSAVMALSNFTWSQSGDNDVTPSEEKFSQGDKFRQLEELLPTPNETRVASGAPGHRYWQQQADYTIQIELDDETQRLNGSETIRYRNNSPDTLRYLWLQLDNNIMARNSDSHLTGTAPDFDEFSFRQYRRLLANETFDGGLNITAVNSASGSPLRHTIVKTMMRVDLERPLRSGESVTFSIDWNYHMNNARVVWARTGYEFFEEDGNYLYEVAHWFPRMVSYTDVNGWHHKQFIGSGEFTLEFGDYDVTITVPEDHVVASTGVLQNASDVLTETQQERLRQAKSATQPMFIVTPEEAAENQKTQAKGKKSWRFKADNVRDFAWASSRKFIWDAVLHNLNGKEVWAMSYYPNEGEPLWSRYSTHSIVHTLDVYSRFTFDYPYPVAISVNGPIGGMEYPMICFNGPRPEEDGTYSKRTKYGLISVIIHEVGHNYFPMIVNSDERQWTWMDEGLNTFVQYLTEQEWEPDYPSRRGEPQNIVNYMTGAEQVPIMTNSESLLRFGANAYAKPATALNVLRETVLGRELFDFAFREYSQRWMFKRPQPADFFRTLEDASGIDLDWFWRGWFYSTDHTDIGIEHVTHFILETGNPDVDKPAQKEEREAAPETLAKKRNKGLAHRSDVFPELLDFYNEFDDLDVTPGDRKEYEEFLEELEPEERAVLDEHRHFYSVELENIGGLVMPVILEITYADDSVEEMRIPAEIWRRNNEQVEKLLLTRVPIRSITLDPHLETADGDLSNNHWPRKPTRSRFQLFKRDKRRNPMQKARDAKKEAEEAAETSVDSDAQPPKRTDRAAPGNR